MLALAAGSLAVLVGYLPRGNMVERLELKTIDARFALRAERPPSDQIAIIDIDDASLAAYGLWAWPRERFVPLIEALTRAGARAIAFDILFAEPGPDAAGRRSDARFAEALRASGRVFLSCARAQEAGAGAESAAAVDRFALQGARVVAGTGLDAFSTLDQVTAATAPLPVFAAAAHGMGFLDVRDSGDGVFRQVPLLVKRRDGLYPSLALALACDVLGVPSDDITVHLGRAISLGGQRVVPMDRTGAMFIDFAGPGHHFRYHSFLKVMRESEENRRQAFKDKIVLIGVTATGLHDLRASPYGAVFNGVETQANVLENLLSGKFLRRQKPELALAYTLCWALLIGFFVPRMSARAYVPLGVALVVVHNLLAYLQFVNRGVAVEVVTPTLGMGLSLAAVAAYWLVTQETRHRTLQTTLSRFVPPEVADHLAQEENLPAFTGERRILTVLFVDLRRFTSASARMAPEDLVSLLNCYFQQMHEVILQFGGTLDKFVGDGVMAFFNAPTEQVDHAHLAIAAALEMQRRLEAYRDEWAFYGMPDLSAGIGISTGEAVVGYVGSGERMQYTAIGQEVNVASRLVELAKELDLPVLISQTTHDLACDMAKCRPLGAFELHNVPEPVTVYEVLGI